MELKVNRPALAGQDIDPDAFQRVWNRVMPGQTSPRGGGGMPLDTTVPAEPSLPPEEVVPPPPPGEGTPPAEPVPPEETPPVQPDLPPVPECSQTGPDQPSVPDCPPADQCPGCPECPDCPQCPECPEVPPAPETPTLCLGEASQGDSARLETLMTLARTGAAAAAAIARRASGNCARTLTAIARDHQTAFRRLSAAYFLITGRRYTPRCPAPCLPPSLALALRQQFVWEQQWEWKNNQAAQSTADPCLRELYLELAQEGAFHAGCIRSLLEQM